MTNILEKAFWMALRSFEHNEHYIALNIFGTPLKACARCLGGFLGAIAAFFIVPMFVPLGPFDFTAVFILSWILAGFAIIDWSSIKAGTRSGNNAVRFITGYLLSFGAMVYLLHLPIPFIYSILSLVVYFSSFLLIQYMVKCREHGLSLRNPIRQNLAVISAATIPLTVGQIGCGHTGGVSCGCCCPCGNCGSCCCSPFCLCLGIFPIIIIMKLIMDRSAKKNDKQIQ